MSRAIATCVRRNGGPISYVTHRNVIADVTDIRLSYDTNYALNRDENHVVVTHNDTKRRYRVFGAECVYDVAVLFFLLAGNADTDVRVDGSRRETSKAIILRDFYSNNKKINKRPVIVSIADENVEFDLSSNIKSSCMSNVELFITQINTESIKSNLFDVASTRRIFPSPATYPPCWSLCTGAEGSDQKTHHPIHSMACQLRRLTSLVSRKNTSAENCRVAQKYAMSLIDDRHMTGLVEVTVAASSSNASIDTLKSPSNGNENDDPLQSLSVGNVDNGKKYSLDISALSTRITITVVYVGFYFKVDDQSIVNRLKIIDRDYSLSQMQSDTQNKAGPLSSTCQECLDGGILVKAIDASRLKAFGAAAAAAAATTTSTTRQREQLRYGDLPRSLLFLEMTYSRRRIKYEKVNNRLKKAMSQRDAIETLVSSHSHSASRHGAILRRVTNVYCRLHKLQRRMNEFDKMATANIDKHDRLSHVTRIFTETVQPIVLEARDLHDEALRMLDSLLSTRPHYTKDDVLHDTQAWSFLEDGKKVKPDVYDMWRLVFPSVVTVEQSHVAPALRRQAQDYNRSVVDYAEKTRQFAKCTQAFTEKIVAYKIIHRVLSPEHAIDATVRDVLTQYFVRHCLDENKHTNPIGWYSADVANTITDRDTTTTDGISYANIFDMYHAVCDDIAVFRHILEDLTSKLLHVTSCRAMLHVLRLDTKSNAVVTANLNEWGNKFKESYANYKKLISMMIQKKHWLSNLTQAKSSRMTSHSFIFQLYVTTDLRNIL